MRLFWMFCKIASVSATRAVVVEKLALQLDRALSARPSIRDPTTHIFTIVRVHGARCSRYHHCHNFQQETELPASELLEYRSRPLPYIRPLTLIVEVTLSTMRLSAEVAHAMNPRKADAQDMHYCARRRISLTIFSASACI